MYPEELLVAAFWRCVVKDIRGKGCTTDRVASRHRRLPYAERVSIKQERLAEQAHIFLDTSDFTWWANQSGLDPNDLKREIYAADH